MSDQGLVHDEDSGQRAFLRRVLAEAAERLGAEVGEEPTFSWRDRTIGAPASVSGELRWLRATAEHEDWAGGEEWIGNVDAVQVADVPKPTVLDRVEWDELPVRIYAELMTYVPDRAISPTAELHAAVDVPARWWTDLRAAIDALAKYPTERGTDRPGRYTPTLRVFFGARADHLTPTWSTEHMDLHWANLTAPNLWVLDWEHWGRAPTGYGAALLYCYSLLVPDAARQVHEVFADLLDSESGTYAQLCAVGHLLRRIDRGDDLDLAIPLHGHADQLLNR